MKKRFTCCLLLWFLPLSVWAQLKLELEPGVAIPFGTLNNQVNPAFGGQLELKYLLTDRFALGLSAGFYPFRGSETFAGFDRFEINATPVLIQSDYYFNDLDEGVIPYLGLGIGLYRLGNRQEFANQVNVIGESYFGLAPKLGLAVQLSDDVAFLGSLRYHYFVTDLESLSFLSIHLGLSLTFLGKY